MYRRPVRRFVPAVRHLVVDGEWATAIMSPPIKAFIRGRAPLVVEKVRREEKEMEAPWCRPEKETIMVGDRCEGGGRETFDLPERELSTFKLSILRKALGLVD